jgi:hypothetical protein
MQKKKDISRRINYDIVSSLLTSDIKGKGKKSKKAKTKATDGAKSKAVGPRSMFDPADLSGLERMETTDDDALSWTAGKHSGPETTFPEDDGYGSDDYQQEA